jgi:hypothetical protein
MFKREHPSKPNGAEAPASPVSPKEPLPWGQQPMSRRDALVIGGASAVSLAVSGPKLFNRLFGQAVEPSEPVGPRKHIRRPKVGMNYVGWKEGQVGSEDSSLGELLNTGVERVIFVPLGFIPQNEIAIRTDTGQTTSADEIRKAIDWTRGWSDYLGREIEVEISPLLIREDGKWRGEYGKGFDQGQRLLFMNAYADFYQPYIEAAQEKDVDMLTLGKELKAATEWQDEWLNFRDNRVRPAYDGKIGYAATSHKRYDECLRMKLWPLFDEIGISEWGSRKDVSWKERKSQYLMLGKRFGKPVSIKELGARSIAYIEQDPTGDTIPLPWIPAEQPQADFYEDALDELLVMSEGLTSVNFWLWNASGRDGDWGTTHSPQDKIAGWDLRSRLSDLHRSRR